MTPENRRLCMLWWLWRLGPKLVGVEASTLFRCAWCNADGEGSRALCPACCKNDDFDPFEAHEPRARCDMN